MMEVARCQRKSSSSTVAQPLASESTPKLRALSTPLTGVDLVTDKGVHGSPGHYRTPRVFSLLPKSEFVITSVVDLDPGDRLPTMGCPLAGPLMLSDT
jgi:hypothetical protein